MDFVVRNGALEDWDFILSTWLRSHKQHGYGAKWIAHKPYFQYQQPLIKRILLRAHVDVAVAPSDSATILGYVVHEPTVLHWLYVKKIFRRFGIGARLLGCLASGVNVYTYRNDTDGAYALIGKHLSALYNPYAVEPASAGCRSDSAREVPPSPSAMVNPAPFPSSEKP